MTPKNMIGNILTKEKCSYGILRRIIIQTINDIDKNTCTIYINMLKFPVKLNKREICLILQFFFLWEFQVLTFINFFPESNTIVIEKVNNIILLLSIVISVISMFLIIYILLTVLLYTFSALLF